ncbi:hypothetical protein [Burkholderia territorii]|uniref:hypothetical protein n=1 Tax=Burkholderia territorii TaxID=1503055 RepID=UPI0007584CEF|nr:hypothetical protein [Burkholderia territorii]KUZ26765.1 hypothetical protein WS52_30550 [Burkholderia territorii]KUZ58359.1 hypothetical protein WS53_09485 [Burkholderia territorii]
MTPGRRSALASLGAMCVQGTWATYANHAFGPWIAGRAAVVQGICSFGMTYAVTRLIEWSVVRFRTDAPTLRAAKTIVLAIGWMLGVQVLAHWLAGTPHIAVTIAPAASLGAIYCTVYTIGRVKLDECPAGGSAGESTMNDGAAANATVAVTHLSDRNA